MRKMVAYHLRNAGFDVTEAPDGREGLELARARRFNLVLTDKNMPHMDGLAFLRALRALPQYAATPILVLTTEAGEDMKAQGKAAGATGWLVKPFDPERLLDVAKKLIGPP